MSNRDVYYSGASKVDKSKKKKFEPDPDIYRTEKSPKDITYNGEIVGYYDTQLAIWRKGSREDPLPAVNNSYGSRKEFLKSLDGQYDAVEEKNDDVTA